MKSKLLHEADGRRTFALIFDKGDEAFAGLMQFVRSRGITAASITAIGAFREARLGYFNRDSLEYDDIPIDEQVEVLSLVGDVAVDEGEPTVHAHVTVGRHDGSTAGGHLQEAIVWPTLEVIVQENPAHLRKRLDRETGLALIDLDAAEEGPP